MSRSGDVSGSDPWGFPVGGLRAAPDRNLPIGNCAGTAHSDPTFVLSSMLRLIVADDSKEDLVLIDRILQKCKLLNQVSLACGAAECIQELKRLHEQDDGGPQPSLVFLDLIMAGQSGLDVLRYLQNIDYRRNCLVVMLSGLRDVKAINEGYQLGAKTFLLKPLTARDVVELVNSLPEITIEETGAGYLLHWKQRLTHDSELLSKGTRIRTHEA